MRYHMAVDSGGTKCSAVLFDDEYRLLAHTVQGSVRTSTTPVSTCRANIRALVCALREQYPGVSSIATLHGALDRFIAENIAEYIPVERFYSESETRLCLAAAGIDAPGLLCLSGTGQFSSYVDASGEKRESMGAYGAMLYDEGSGYHIGRMALSAAIRYEESGGTPTSLHEAIRRLWEADTFREAVFRIGSATDGSGVIPRVASLSRLVSEEADRGDRVAREILCSAGELLGRQMNGLIRRQHVPDTVPIAVAGGVFGGSSLLVDAFVQTVRKENPEREIRWPIFVPVVGAVIAQAFEEGRTEDCLDFFRQEYAVLRMD